MPKKLYTAFSMFGFFWNLFLRLIFLAALIALLMTIRQNPVLTIVLGVCLLLVFSFIGDDMIVVYSDKVVRTTNSVASLFQKGQTFFMHDIVKAYLPEEFSEKFSLGFGLLTGMLIPKPRTVNRSTSFLLELKDGKIVDFKLTSSRKKLRRLPR